MLFFIDAKGRPYSLLVVFSLCFSFVRSGGGYNQTKIHKLKTVFRACTQYPVDVSLFVMFSKITQVLIKIVKDVDFFQKEKTFHPCHSLRHVCILDLKIK